MRAGFVTAVELGRVCIEEIHAAGGSLALAVTLRDEQAAAKSGRVLLDDLCARHDTPLLKVRNINDPEAVAALGEARLDWLFIVGWSQIARPEVLATAARGVLGIHPTLLPEGRGRAPIPWAILKGLTRTGVTLFRLDAGVDSGPIAGQLEIPIAPDETATTLYEKVAVGHRQLIRDCWPRLEAGTVEFRPQDDTRASHWPGRRPEDGRIDPAGRAADAERLVRAVTRPYPGAFLDHGGVRYRLWSARLGSATGAPPGATVAGDTLRIEFPDGALLSTDWESTTMPKGHE
jgi:methionyl-tRNA formyltransferase